MNVCVFCSAQDVPKNYNDAAIELGTRIAKGGHALVWGGSNEGIMRTLADSVQGEGGKLVGVSMEILKEHARKEVEMIVEKDLAARKATMLTRSDAFIALPGGIGTLDEITDIIALKRHRLHEKPIVFLDTDGFWDGTRQQFEAMERDGFFADGRSNVIAGWRNLVNFSNTPAEAIGYIEGHAR
jgi:uncharacterized protein (TIGR00730 family)